jgi:hypothetical protein
MYVLLPVDVVPEEQKRVVRGAPDRRKDPDQIVEVPVDVANNNAWEWQIQDNRTLSVSERRNVLIARLAVSGLSGRAEGRRRSWGTLTVRLCCLRRDGSLRNRVWEETEVGK